MLMDVPSNTENQKSYPPDKGGSTENQKSYPPDKGGSRGVANNPLAHRNIPITIIGGGIHGISIAIRLLREVPTAATHLAIVDRHPRPLTQWRRKTERQGMMFLRSPAVHHITPDALGIVEYAEHHNRTTELAPPYSQPSTQLFWDFCSDTLAELAQHRIYHQFDVTKLRWDKGAGKFPFRLISKDSDGFRSRCVILAIGADDCTYVPPEFVQWQNQYPDRILHASEFNIEDQDRQDGEEFFVIVGGGLTAGTIAKSLSERGHSVALIARKPLKTEQFDFPPVWLGPKALAEFADEMDFQQRYEIIQQNRGEGSITPDIMEALTDAANIKMYPETRIQNILSLEEGTCRSGVPPALRVSTNRGDILNVSRVILATGYQFNLCRYGFLKELIAQHQVPLVHGLPRLDTDLQLYPVENLFGSGTIAQLQIGPASSNIAGANLAYEHLREKLFVHL
ncbi:hypothetical protein C6496_00040 [Candidatus Poribacteria bacterium]|nr:MAG: hypothetical protein C6496_00040 [Candidatus Poribacteria bacterium]